MADLFEDAEEEVAPNVVSLHQSVQPVATITSQAPAAATLPKSKQPVSQRYNDDDDGDAPAFQAEEFPSLGSSGVAPAVWPKQAAAAAAQHSAAAPATPVNKPIKTLGKPPGSKPAAPKSTPPPTTPSETATSTPAEVFDRSKSDLLVVDAAAFIKNVPLQDMAHRLVTLSDVVAEIRDAETRRRLQVLPYELELREPSSEAIKFVTQFSKATGDFMSLSAPDLRVVALTYQLEKEMNGDEHLHKAPRKLKGPGSIPKACRYGNSCRRKHVCWYQHPLDGEEDPSIAATQLAKDASSFGHDVPEADTAAEETGGAEETEESDAMSAAAMAAFEADDSGWIGPANLTQVTEQIRTQTLGQAASVKVGCITADYAMQNVLLQIGLHVVSMEGMLIKRVKSFVLYCTACFRHTSKVTTQFCPSCGKPSLIKAACSVDAEGNMSVQVPRLRKAQVRGTRFSLPMPKGGRHNNIILRSDQPEMLRHRPTKKEVDVFGDGFVNSKSPFGTVHRINVQGGGSGHVSKQVVGYGRHNPNEKKPTRKGKRNK